MADVFISYSSHDHDKAAKLTERLREAGLSVWIDETNISAATQWSSEIVKAIEDCKVFVILLSPSSFGSHNVIKELSLASEEKKHIVPVELETLELTHEVKYQLAGIQRVSYKNYEAIEQAVQKFITDLPTSSEGPTHPISKKPKVPLWKKIVPVFALVAFGVYLYFQVIGKETVPADHSKASEVKKVLVLPFVSLSDNKDDAYFADGLTSEIITTLSSLHGLQVTDRQTAMQYKGRKADLKAIAKELDIRYVVDGTIQKQGDQVKISMQVVDAESGKTILSENYDGSLDNLFSLQSKIAKSVAFELQGSLVRDQIDTTSMKARTKNPAAYSKLITVLGMIDNIDTKEQLEHGIVELQQISKLDPQYVEPYFYLGLAYLARSRTFTHNKRDMDMADSLARLALRMDSTYPDSHILLANIAGERGELDAAVAEVVAYQKLRPDNIAIYGYLGNLFYSHGQFDRAATYLERSVQMNITNLSNWTILIDCYQSLGDTVKRNKYIDESQPLYELYLSKYPSSSSTRAHYALNLANRGKKDEAHRQIELIKSAAHASPVDFYNAACTYGRLNEPKEAIEMLKKSFETGYNPGQAVNKDPDLVSLHDLPEFKALAAKMIEANKEK
ncbi:MAG TPA: FlgO family outer membrane protein [Candidatus Kapabacteria bacterium]|nr:FlgO family outer membrane protein [Candidatus Kapabacteria bacterium]